METELMKKVIDGEIIMITKIVRKQLCSGVIYVPKKYIGKKATIIIKESDN